MKSNLYYFARANAFLVLIFGLIMGIYDSTSFDSSFAIFTTSEIDNPFSWSIFMKWMFGTYCASSILFVLSEMIKGPTKERTTF